MNSARDNKEKMSISEQAAFWLHLLKDGNPSPAQRREYLRWLKKSQRHVSEALHVKRIDQLLHRGAGHKIQPAAPSERKNVDQKIIPFPQSAIRRDEVETLQDAPSRHARVRRNILKAAGFGFAAVLVTQLVKVASVDQTIVTAKGEWTKVRLDDGSWAHVAPSSELRTHFSKERRSLVLSRGEAMFDVAKDASRPFVVATYLGTITAVGTHFGVSHRDGLVIVTVSEGEVAVRPMQSGQAEVPEQRPIPLKANQQLVLSPTSPPKFIDPVDAIRELKWLQDWVESNGDTVAQMVGELNRRNEVQIVVADPVVRNLRITTLGFKPNQPEVLVDWVNAGYAGAPGKKGKVALRLERP